MHHKADGFSQTKIYFLSLVLSSYSLIFMSNIKLKLESSGFRNLFHIIYIFIVSRIFDTLPTSGS